MSTFRLASQWKRRLALITFVAVVFEFFVLPLLPNSPSVALAAEAINDGGAAGSANYYQQELEKFGKGIDHVRPTGVLTYTYPMGPVAAAYHSAVFRSPDGNFDRPAAPPTQDVSVTRSFLDAQQGRVAETANFKGDLSRVTVKHVTTTVMDEENRATVTTRDPANQRAVVTDAMGGITTYKTAFEHEHIIDADGCATHRWFNWAGELLTLIDPDLGTWRDYTYDLNGNLLAYRRQRPGLKPLQLCHE